MTLATKGRQTAVSGADGSTLKLRRPLEKKIDRDEAVETKFGEREGKDAQDQTVHSGIQTSLDAPEFGGPIGTGFLILWSHYSACCLPFSYLCRSASLSCVRVRARARVCVCVLVTRAPHTTLSLSPGLLLLLPRDQRRQARDPALGLGASDAPRRFCASRGNHVCALCSGAGAV